VPTFQPRGEQMAPADSEAALAWQTFWLQQQRAMMQQ
jgi:hypothetical protein